MSNFFFYLSSLISFHFIEREKNRYIICFFLYHYHLYVCVCVWMDSRVAQKLDAPLQKERERVREDEEEKEDESLPRLCIYL